MEKTSLPWMEELKRLIPERRVQLAWLVLAVVFAWFYWRSLGKLTRIWWGQEDYQHGFIVPIFALFLLWHRRDMLREFSGRGSLWGLPLFGAWAAIRWTAVYYNYDTLPEISIIPFFLAVTVFVGGWQGLRWAWPSILFLFFMLPLPGAVQGLASQKLQSVATRISIYVIQTLGIPAITQGNVIQLTAERQLNVAEACSGLRMMMLFFAICVGAAFIVRKPLWERLLMVASAPPIAVLSNVSRIVLTAVFYQIGIQWPSVIDLDTAGEIIHDWAGYLMMPIGLLLLLAEMTLLAKLLIAPPEHSVLAGEMLAGGEATAATHQVLRRRRR
jgi:exosortase